MQPGWIEVSNTSKAVLLVFRIAAKSDVAHRESVTNRTVASLPSSSERQYSSIHPVFHFCDLVITMTEFTSDSFCI